LKTQEVTLTNEKGTFYFLINNNNNHQGSAIPANSAVWFYSLSKNPIKTRGTLKEQVIYLNTYWCSEANNFNQIDTIERDRFLILQSN